MIPDQIKAIQHSFDKVSPIADQAAALFYGRLFEIAPEVKPLFRGDMTEQGRKLMATLAVVVQGLDNLESVLPAASALAKRHVGYGVRAADYAPVGAALLWTLEQGLGEAFTPDVREAWVEAWQIVAGAMVTGMRNAELEDVEGGQLPMGRADAAPSSMVSATRL